MTFLDTFLSVLSSILSVLWDLFKEWIFFFFVPFKNFDVLWIIIPIWLAWFFADYFQEKQSTSFGNAVSNGVVPIWVGIDWMRLIVGSLVEGIIRFGWGVVLNILISLGILTYGTIIVYGGFKAKKWSKKIGRIREVTYLLLMFTPIIYGLIDLTFYRLAAIILYFPLFYFGITLFFKYMPTPKAMRRDS